MMYMVTLFMAAEGDPEISMFEVYSEGDSARAAMLRARKLLPALVQLPPRIGDLGWCSWEVPGSRKEGLRKRRVRAQDRCMA